MLFSPELHIGSSARPAPNSESTTVLSLQQSGQRLNLTTYSHLVQKLIMRGGGPPCTVRDDFCFASYRGIYSNKTRWQKKKKSLLSGKIKGDIYWYDVSESKYGNQNALSSIIFNLLKPTGHVMHQQFNIQQLYVLPTLYLCVLYLSNNKQRLVPLTA
jgi:hypothetical protein